MPLLLRREFLLGAAASITALGVASLAAASGQTASPSSPMGGTEGRLQAPAAFDSTNFGYHVDLPPGWRNSARLSRFIDGTYNRGHDVFTVRSDADEASAVTEHWLGPAWQGVVLIEVYRNTAGLTPLAWATRPEWDWRHGQTVRTVTFAGREAVLIQSGPRFTEAYYVANGSDMFVVGFIKGPSQPASVKDADLASIVRSFRFT